MKSCKSLAISNKVLEGLINSEQLEKCWYHSFYSGGMNPDGFCGYVVYGKCARNTIKITFYSTNKNIDTPIHIFVLVDGKSKIRDEQLSAEDAIKFIVNRVTKFMPKVKRGTHTDA